MNGRENSYFDWLTTHYEDSPFWKHMNIKVLRIDEGDIKLEMKINPELLNVLGTLHGGAYSSLLDATMGLTVRSVIDSFVTTINLNVSYLKPVKEGRIWSHGTILNQGRSICIVESRLYDDSDQLLTHGTGSFKIIKKR
jgi:uncharacterized protein (TIGR00369 family)